MNRRVLIYLEIFLSRAELQYQQTEKVMPLYTDQVRVLLLMCSEGAGVAMAVLEMEFSGQGMAGLAANRMVLHYFQRTWAQVVVNPVAALVEG